MMAVREVAARLGHTRVEPILKLIDAGALRAVNTSAGPGRRTWRIPEEAVAEFIANRTFIPCSTPSRRGRRKPAELVPKYV
jgi:excisionase family DNA binding protein